MLDEFDLQLLDQLQRDNEQTAERLAEKVSLSPSAIARRLRRLRAEGWIAGGIALLSPRLAETRLRAIVTIVLNEHADKQGKAALLNRLIAEEQVQFVYEITGALDLLVLVDCPHMAAFNALAEEIIAADPTVRRYETSFVKRDFKFAPFIRLAGG
ncbi:Lrp/AsnC family transcriptional regulator [Sphingomonas lutea]|uniref:Lrp/AsnC family transcriptional regulator n=1 Tax=Sphingomonas lutea TaxID=1045317 RepID=A0A7G9SJA5_9SPHN|nr:Lrp/AsnC family transcriptional regulator [Sphingomonas lutea]QNN67930.1 Lrp/AsnC family transcriptional regulator [Sphingomonas lutea]